MRKNRLAAVENRSSNQGNVAGILTAWFNPWSHQSGDQVWAGLTDCIVEAVSPVLYPCQEERDRYWFNRNLTRLDSFTVRKNLVRRVVSPLGGIALLAILIPAALALASIRQALVVFDIRINDATISLVLATITAMVIVIDTLRRYFHNEASRYFSPELFRGPVPSSQHMDTVGATSGSFVDPLIQSPGGSLYLDQHDVARLLEDLRAKGYMLVTFVDDIDRCSTATMAEVFEAVNLFMSGVNALENGPQAGFVIGIDPSVVAAHLDHVYEQSLGHDGVNHGDDPSPGWAFLRKFVQLPVRLPHISDYDVRNFLSHVVGNRSSYSSDRQEMSLGRRVRIIHRPLAATLLRKRLNSHVLKPVILLNFGIQTLWCDHRVSNRCHGGPWKLTQISKKLSLEG